MLKKILILFLFLFFTLGVGNTQAQTCASPTGLYECGRVYYENDINGNPVRKCTDGGGAYLAHCAVIYGQCKKTNNPCNGAGLCDAGAVDPCSGEVSGGGGGGGGGGSCGVTKPKDLVVTALSSTKARIDWDPGTGAGSQRIYVGPDLATVNNNCPDSAAANKKCVVSKIISEDADSYTTKSDEALTAGDVYYWRILTYKSASCNKEESTESISSCAVTPSSAGMNVGDPVTITSSVLSSSLIDKVTFSGGSGYFTLSKTQDTTSPYDTVATGVSATDPTATLTSSVYFDGNNSPVCTSTAPVTVVNPVSIPWWQVVDSDVLSKTSLISDIPSGEYFSLAGAGGFAGVSSYSSDAGGSTNLTAVDVSSDGWLIDSPYSSLKEYDYRFFENQIPADVISTITTVADTTTDASFFETGGTLANGYYWYKYDGGTTGLDLTITGDMDLGDRKVILLVESASVNLEGNIALDNGLGFFMLVTQGDINIDPAVTSLEGMYVADSGVYTGESANQLYIRGSVVGYDGVVLERDVDTLNSTTPSEVFEYAADQILLFPYNLGYRLINWTEVAP